MDAVEAEVRNIVDELTARGIGELDVVDCDPELADTADFCRAYGYEMDDSANAIMVIGKSDPPVYAMCLVLATTRLDVNRTVRKRLGTRKASFAPSEVTVELTGMTPGGVTPLARPADLPLWVDARVMERDRIVIGGGSRNCKVVGPPSVLLELPAVEIIEGLAIPSDGDED